MTITEETIETKPPWVITWDGHSWSESDLTGQHLAVLALITGHDDFDQLELNPTLGHQRLMMLIEACMVVESTRGTEIKDPDELAALVAGAISQVTDASIDEIFGALSYET